MNENARQEHVMNENARQRSQTPQEPPLYLKVERQVQALNLSDPAALDAERQLILLEFQTQLARRYAAHLNDGTRRNLWKEACRQSRHAGEIVPAETEEHYRELAKLFGETLNDLPRQSD